MNTTNPLYPAQRAAVTRKRREAARKAATKNSEKQARHRLRAAMRYTGALIALADALKHTRRLVASQSLTRCLTTSIATSQRRPPRDLRRINLPTNPKESHHETPHHRPSQ